MHFASHTHLYRQGLFHMTNFQKILFYNTALLLLILTTTTSVRSAEQDLPKNFKDGFAFKNNDTVIFAGSSRITHQIESGYLETLLTKASNDKQVRFRDLAWQADTVYPSPRRNRGSRVWFVSFDPPGTGSPRWSSAAPNQGIPMNTRIR